MIEVFFGFSLVGLLISLFFSVSNERYTNELSKAIDDLNREGKSMTALIRDDYSLSTVDDAIEALAKLKATFIDQIYWFTKHIE